jgi:carboxymethylenebutenolidase
VYEQNVVITTQHGRMPAFAACPDGQGPWPAVIFYMDARGMREELRNMARRIAKAGYFCLLPDLYYRLGRIEFDLQKRDETMITIIRAASRSFTRDWVISDTAAMLAFLDAQDGVTDGAMGCVGYCIGGPFVTWAAATFPSHIAAAAGICGVRMVTDTPDSPHLFAPEIKAELYYAFAEKDHFSPPDLIADLRAALQRAKCTFEIDVFEGTDHGFVFPERDAHMPEPTEAHWRRLFDLFGRRLKA